MKAGSSPLTRGKPAYANGGIWDAGLIPAHAGKTQSGSRRLRARAAHPRSRGENAQLPGVSAPGLGLIPAHAGKTDRTQRRSCVERGSSPLTRGKHLAPQLFLLGHRLIPAHAGKTQRVSLNRSEMWAHPRSRGENPPQGSFIFHDWGSSPLTRGKQLPAEQASSPLRLIPAHAGKTAVRRGQPRPSWAHPRSRGENARSARTSRADAGSSPLTRGKLRRSDRRETRQRLIPAHAGKTAMSCSIFGSIWAHPRSRGENIKSAVGSVIDWGSSPLTRGKPQSRAGRCNRRTAHPRSRGENSNRLLRIGWLWGSSPLTRGKQPGKRLRGDCVRLIPAHAGKTRVLRTSRLSRWAHPRSRGENSLPACGKSSHPGSSPLTRGKPQLPGVPASGSGLIPAHAGKTVDQTHGRGAVRAHPRSRGENAPALVAARIARGSSPLTRGKPIGGPF